MRQVIIALALILSNQTSAVQILTQRCSEDSLDMAQAENRIKWGIKCYPFLQYVIGDGITIIDPQTNQAAPGYPVFAEISPNGEKKIIPAPIDPSAPCWDTNRYLFYGVCRAGCFTPDQKILFKSGNVAIGKAYQQQVEDIITAGTLRNDSSMPLLTPIKLSGYTVDDKDHEQTILVFSTETGGQIKVTKNHPLVDGEGYMREASEMNVGDSLYTVFGTKEKILSIEPVQYFGKVYNIEMGSTRLEDNVIVAQGFLSGTAFYQNEGHQNINRLVLRQKTLIPDALVR